MMFSKVESAGTLTSMAMQAIQLDPAREFELILNSALNPTVKQEISYALRAMNLNRSHPDSFYTHLAAAVVSCFKKCFPIPVHQYYEVSLHLGKAGVALNMNSLSELSAFEKVMELTEPIFERHDFSLVD